MKTGNKSQATILSIVAVGAVAFLIIELMPAKMRPHLGVLTGGSPPSGNMSVQTNLPLMLVGDPFSHPKLAVKQPTPAAPTGSNGQSMPPRDIQIGGLPGVVSPMNPLGGDDGYGPAESAGTSQQKQQGPQISVVAIMCAETHVAMLGINGKDATAHKEGDLLAKNAQLVGIYEGYVTVRINGVDHDLRTGDTFASD